MPAKEALGEPAAETKVHMQVCKGRVPVCWGVIPLKAELCVSWEAPGDARINILMHEMIWRPAPAVCEEGPHAACSWQPAEVSGSPAVNITGLASKLAPETPEAGVLWRIWGAPDVLRWHKAPAVVVVGASTLLIIRALQPVCFSIYSINCTQVVLASFTHRGRCRCTASAHHLADMLRHAGLH